MISRGSICWTNLGDPDGSRPAKVRPVLVIQSDNFNSSRLATTIVAVITSNTGKGNVEGNVFISAATSGLSKDSAVDVTALQTVNKRALDPPVGRLPESVLEQVDAGLKLALGI